VVRLRQVVLVARDLESVVATLRARLALGEPFRDPAVAAFGLQNAVMALGDTFVEVVSPIAPGTAAGRHLDRRGGDGGYMVMFELEDIEGARRRAAAVGIREVFAVELPDIVDVHLHPSDIGGAIVALDRPEPPGAWRSDGPARAGRRRTLHRSAGRARRRHRHIRARGDGRQRRARGTSVEIGGVRFALRAI
jgi:hypothetical protein